MCNDIVKRYAKDQNNSRVFIKTTKVAEVMALDVKDLPELLIFAGQTPAVIIV